MALVGDNCASMSTLTKVLAGAHVADEGAFFLDGKTITISNPNDATALGIQKNGYQDLALCENLDVASNLSLGVEPVKPDWGFLPRILRPLADLEMEIRAHRANDQLEAHTLKSVRAKVGELRELRETQLGAFVPVLLALALIWGISGWHCRSTTC